MDYRKKLGDNIRTIRKLRNLSIKELAEKGKLTEKYLNSVELGKNNISFDNLILLCNALEIEPNQLLKFSAGNEEELINKLIALINNDDKKHIELYIKLIQDIQSLK